MSDESTTLTQLKEARQSLALQAETAQLADEVGAVVDEKARRILESIADVNNFVDPYRWRAAEPGYLLGHHGFGHGHAGLHIASVHDRAGGRDRPLFETEQDLRTIIGQARILAGFNITAVGILDTLANYTVGVGFDYGAAARRRRDNVPEALIDEVNAAIDETIEANRWAGGEDGGEREVFKRAVRDGDQPVVTFALPGGQTEWRIIDTLAVTEPSDARAVEEWAIETGLRPDVAGCWKFGVDSAHGDAERVYGYYAQWTQNPGDFDYIPAARVVHFKRNVDRGVKRGVSDFFPAIQWLNRVDKIDGNLADSAAVQAAIAWVKNTAKGVTQTQAAANRITMSDHDITIRRADGSDRTHYAHHYDPGTTITAPNGQMYAPGPGPVNAQGFYVLIQIINRLLGRRWDMPEFMVSGDASNANFASTVVAESPFVKATEVRQSGQIDGSSRLLWISLANFIKVGRFAQWGVQTLAQLKRIIKLVIKAPDIVSRDKTKETTRRKLLHDDGILSKETWSAEESIDRETEVAQGAAPVLAVPAVATPESQTGLPAPVPSTTQAAAVPSSPALPATTTPAAPQAVTPEATPENVTTTDALNGAQITAAITVLDGVVAGTTAPGVAVELLIAVGISQDKAKGMVDETVAKIPKPAPTEPAKLTEEQQPAVRQNLSWEETWEGYA